MDNPAIQFERRSLPVAELRIIPTEKGRMLQGYAAVFNSRSDDMGGWFEVIDPHAFDKTLAAKPDVLALYAHDAKLVLGRTTANTLSLSVDAKGLAYRCSLPNTSTANDLIELIERKDISGNSFGFICVKDDWTEDADGTIIRTLLEVELIEITVTALPAYSETSLSLRTKPSGIKIKSLNIPCTCPCSQCAANACNICSTTDCEYVGCACPEQNSMKKAEDKPRTKEVDGEHLPAESFLIVGDPSKTDTWKLPVLFSTDEKTKSHIIDALSRFDQLEDVSDKDKEDAFKKLINLAKKYQIQVDPNKDWKDEETARSAEWKETMELRIRALSLQNKFRS